MISRTTPTHARVTIKDVAKAAGVGMVSVSRALNDQPGVSAETRQRIQQIAEQLGYRANRHARFLKLANNQQIAVMMKGIDNPFFQLMMETMENAARERDYLLTVVKVPHYADEVEEAIKLVDEDATSGIVFLGGNFTHDTQIFARFRVPFVLSTIGNLVGISPTEYSSVSIDDLSESRRVVEYLLGLGHRKIALIGVDMADESVGRLRAQGYLAALAEAGATLDEDLVRSVRLDGRSPYNFDYGYQLTRVLLTERPDVTAIFAVADVMAVGALKAAAELGVQVPDQLSIVGFDGIPLTRYVHPSLTTLAQPARQIAKLTIDILFETMAGKPVRHELLSGALQIGGSTGRPRVGDLSLASR